MNKKGIFGIAGFILALAIIFTLAILGIDPNKSSNNIITPVVDSNFQPLVPMKEWDWDIQATGSISQEQFELSDHIPQSCEPFDQFTSSSQSLSDNYRAFLYALDPEFQPESFLEDAKSKIEFPNGSPGESFKPRGWTIVKGDDGIDHWEPYWGVSNQPGNWINSIKAQGGNGGTIGIPLKISGSNNLLEFPIGDKVFQLIVKRPSYMEISAEAWDRIQIYPGDWYDSGMIKLGSKGPFLQGYIENRRGFNDTKLVPIFGPGGLLRCRVSELVVASKPCLRILIDNGSAAPDREGSVNTTEVQMNGSALNKSKSSNADARLEFEKSDNGIINYYCSTSSDPVIVGVIIEKINPDIWADSITSRHG